MPMNDAAGTELEILTGIRHRIHRHPEIGLDLPHTQRVVLDELADLGLEIHTGTGTTSVTAVLRGGAVATHERPVVLLRGDMDALPLTEENDLPYKSEIDGVMHACGHDMHTTMLIGAARYLSARRADLPGDVIFMFQPGEEGWDGARIMIEEGVLETAGHPLTAAYALHVSAGRMPRGTVISKPGPVLASTATLDVTVHGQGGHVSRPHTTRDPIPVACEIVLALQTLLARQIDPFEPTVLTVGTIHAGTRSNIVPDEATFQATVRTFSADVQDHLAESTVRLTEQIAAAHGLTATAIFEREYPALMNDPNEFEFASGVVTDLFGADRFETMEPAMSAEDFARVLQAAPGAMVFMGACHEDRDWRTAPDNHTAQATYSDAVLGEGAMLLAELAQRRLLIG